MKAPSKIVTSQPSPLDTYYKVPLYRGRISSSTTEAYQKFKPELKKETRLSSSRTPCYFLVVSTPFRDIYGLEDYRSDTRFGKPINQERDKTLPENSLGLEALQLLQYPFQKASSFTRPYRRNPFSPHISCLAFPRTRLFSIGFRPGRRPRGNRDVVRKYQAAKPTSARSGQEDQNSLQYDVPISESAVTNRPPQSIDGTLTQENSGGRHGEKVAKQPEISEKRERRLERQKVRKERRQRKKEALRLKSTARERIKEAQKENKRILSERQAQANSHKGAIQNPPAKFPNISVTSSIASVFTRTRQVLASFFSKHSPYPFQRPRDHEDKGIPPATVEGYATSPSTSPAVAINRSPVKMLFHLQFITTPSADTPGTTMLLHFENRRYLFGQIAEGTQRACIERGISLMKVQHVFLTGNMNWQATGGLLGLILTMADAHTSRLLSNKDADKPSLHIAGGSNLLHTLACARRFVFRKNLPLSVSEFDKQGFEFSERPTWSDDNIKVWAMTLRPSGIPGGQNSSQEGVSNSETVEGSDSQAVEARKALVDQMFNSNWSLDRLDEVPLSEVRMPAKVFVRDSHGFKAYDGPLPGGREPVPDLTVLVRRPWPAAATSTLPPASSSTGAMAYIVQSHDRRGKFQASSAKRLGVKPGPDFGRLAAGETVQSNNGDWIKPEMVLEKSRPGSGIAIIELPDEQYIDDLVNRSEWKSPQIMEKLEAIIWLLPAALSDNKALNEFAATMPNVQHLYSSPAGCANAVSFEASAMNSIRLSSLSPQHFTIPLHQNTSVDELRLQNPDMPFSQGLSQVQQTPIQRGMTLRVRPKLFLSRANVHEPLNTEAFAKAISPEIVEHAKALQVQSQRSGFQEYYDASQSDLPGKDAEIVTLGTGSALPSKHRNVSATLLNVPEHGSYLLDCGENTLGQLKRMYSPSELQKILLDLRLVWISHLHADHHLGLVALINAHREASARNTLPCRSPQKRRLVILSDNSLHRFLTEYASTGSLDLSDCHLVCVDWKAQLHPFRSEHEDFSITENSDELGGLANILVCPVSHCQGSKAISLVFPDNFKVSYSGDCRPSKKFISMGRDSTVLIHEATFDNEKAGDALAKKHSTTGEALGVGLAMGAKRMILTHFSQRYRDIPVLQDINLSALRYEDVSDDEDGADEPIDDGATGAVNELAFSLTRSNDSPIEPGSTQRKLLSNTETQKAVESSSRGLMKVAVAFDLMKLKVRDIARMETLSPALTEMFQSDERKGNDDRPPDRPEKKRQKRPSDDRKEERRPMPSEEHPLYGVNMENESLKRRKLSSEAKLSSEPTNTSNTMPAIDIKNTVSEPTLEDLDITLRPKLGSTTSMASKRSEPGISPDEFEYFRLRCSLERFNSRAKPWETMRPEMREALQVLKSRSEPIKFTATSCGYLISRLRAFVGPGRISVIIHDGPLGGLAIQQRLLAELHKYDPALRSWSHKLVELGMSTSEFISLQGSKDMAPGEYAVELLREILVRLEARRRTDKLNHVESPDSKIELSVCSSASFPGPSPASRNWQTYTSMILTELDLETLYNAFKQYFYQDAMRNADIVQKLLNKFARSETFSDVRSDWSQIFNYEHAIYARIPFADQESFVRAKSLISLKQRSLKLLYDSGLTVNDLQAVMDFYGSHDYPPHQWVVLEMYARGLIRKFVEGSQRQNKLIRDILDVQTLGLDDGSDLLHAAEELERKEALKKGEGLKEAENPSKSSLTNILASTASQQLESDVDVDVSDRATERTNVDGAALEKVAVDEFEAAKPSGQLQKQKQNPAGVYTRLASDRKAIENLKNDFKAYRDFKYCTFHTWVSQKQAKDPVGAIILRRAVYKYRVRDLPDQAPMRRARSSRQQILTVDHAVLIFLCRGETSAQKKLSKIRDYLTNPQQFLEHYLVREKALARLSRDESLIKMHKANQNQIERFQHALAKINAESSSSSNLINSLLLGQPNSVLTESEGIAESSNHLYRSKATASVPKETFLWESPTSKENRVSHDVSIIVPKPVGGAETPPLGRFSDWACFTKTSDTIFSAPEAYTRLHTSGNAEKRDTAVGHEFSENVSSIDQSQAGLESRTFSKRESASSSRMTSKNVRVRKSPTARFEARSQRQKALQSARLRRISFVRVRLSRPAPLRSSIWEKRLHSRQNTSKDVNRTETQSTTSPSESSTLLRGTSHPLTFTDNDAILGIARPDSHAPPRPATLDHPASTATTDGSIFIRRIPDSAKTLARTKRIREHRSGPRLKRKKTAALASLQRRPASELVVTKFVGPPKVRTLWNDATPKQSALSLSYAQSRAEKREAMAVHKKYNVSQEGVNDAFFSRNAKGRRRVRPAVPEKARNRNTGWMAAGVTPLSGTKT